MRGLTALVLLAARVAAEAPLVAFSTHGLPFSGTLTRSLSGDDVDRLFADAVGLGDTHVFVVDELSSDAFSSLSSHATFVSPLSAINSRVAVSPFAVLAPRVLFKSGAVESAAAAKGCKVSVVQDSAAASRAAYLKDAAGGKEESAGVCRVFVSTLSRTRLAAELDFVAAVATALGNAASGRQYAVVLTAVPPASAEPPRGLAAATPTVSPSPGAAALRVTVPQVYATPTILMGLLLGLLLLLFTLVGLYCVMAVESPDVMHSFALPAGKEY